MNVCPWPHFEESFQFLLLSCIEQEMSSPKKQIVISIIGTIVFEALWHPVALGVHAWMPL